MLCFSLLDSCTHENMLPLNGLSWRRAFVVYGSPAKRAPTLLFLKAKIKMQSFAPKYFTCLRGPHIFSCARFFFFFFKLQSRSSKVGHYVIIFAENKLKTGFMRRQAGEFSCYKFSVRSVLPKHLLVWAVQIPSIWFGLKTQKSKIDLWSEHVQASSCLWVTGQLLASAVSQEHK